MKEERRHILFIASWFPNRIIPNDGNFIAKYARAVAPYHQLTVVAVHRDPGLAPFQFEVVEGREHDYTVITCYYGAQSTLGVGWAKYRAYRKVLRRARQLGGKPELIHAHVLWDAGIVARVLARSWACPYLLSEHSSIYLPESPHSLSGWQRYVLARVTRRAFRVLPVSKALRRGMEANGLLGRYEVLPNLVDAQLFSLAKISPNQARRFLHISNFDPAVKRVDQIIEAFVQIRKEGVGVELTIAGDGNPVQLTRWREQYDPQGEWLELFGAQSEEQVAALLHSHHALVLFSAYETQSVVALEAQLAGLPVLAPKVGGLPEIVREAWQGMLFPPGDLAALQKAIRETYANPKTFDAQRIRQAALSRYRETDIVQQLLSLYENAIVKAEKE